MTQRELVQFMLEESNIIENEPKDRIKNQTKIYFDLLSKPFVLISDKIICNVHTAVCDDQLKLPENVTPGEYRTYNVLVDNHRCPDYKKVPELIADYIKITSNLETFVKKDGLIPALAKNHSFFEQIHPFGDGNGRTGRILLNWLLYSFEQKQIIVIKSTDKIKYYTALNIDNKTGDIKALTDLFEKSIYEIE